MRTVLKKFTWSIRDKAAYRELLDDLVGFNDTLEKILPGPMQDFLETVLPATACASSNESELPSLEEASAQHAFLKSQVQWTSSVHAIGVIPRGTQLDEKTLEKCDEIGRNKNCYLAKRSKDKSNEYLLVDWSPWETASKERTERMGSVSGLLGESKCKELRLLTCLGYLEEQDTRSQKCRYALVYDLMVGKNSPSVIATAPRKLRTLSQLLENFKTVQFPPLETRLLLARSLCRAMLLYHSSGWIHHDFRSHNVILVGGSAIIDGTAKTYAADYQGLNMDELFIIGLGHSRDEADVSLMFADRKAISKTLKQQRRYWSPDYLLSSGRQRTARMFQRSHDIYSLGCVLLEIGVWRPLESYTWESAYDEDHTKWHKRLLREEGKLRAMCGSRYTEAVMTCLNWTTSDIGTDVQNLAFDILLKLEEIMV